MAIGSTDHRLLGDELDVVARRQREGLHLLFGRQRGGLLGVLRAPGGRPRRLPWLVPPCTLANDSADEPDCSESENGASGEDSHGLVCPSRHDALLRTGISRATIPGVESARPAGPGSCSVHVEIAVRPDDHVVHAAELIEQRLPGGSPCRRLISSRRSCWPASAATNRLFFQPRILGAGVEGDAARRDRRRVVDDRLLHAGLGALGDARSGRPS